MQVAQRLYPQCQSCFSLQGGAVRSNIHHLIYHYKLQIYHFAPFFIHYLSSNGSFIEFLENCVKHIEEYKSNHSWILKFLDYLPSNLIHQFWHISGIFESNRYNPHFVQNILTNILLLLMKQYMSAGALQYSTVPIPGYFWIWDESKIMNLKTVKFIPRMVIRTFHSWPKIRITEGLEKFKLRFGNKVSLVVKRD